MKSSEENKINTYPNIKECLDGNNQTLKTLKGCRNDEKDHGLQFVAKEPKIMNCVLQTLDAIILDCYYQLISFYEKWFT